MKLSLIQTNQFPQWKQMRQAVYSSLDEQFHELEMNQIFARDDWFCYFLTDESNKVLGLVELSSRNIADGCLNSPVAYFEGLYLKKEHREKGMGKEAVRLILNWCKERGYTELATDSELSNISAQKFFKATGFQETYRVVEFRTKVK